jgi:hypothetical protein
MMYGHGLIIDMTKGQEAYIFRQRYRCSWSLVAKEVGYCNSQSALRAARNYATRTFSPWPLRKASKGACIYKSRQYGMTWMSIARNYNQSIAAIQRCSYKWAKRSSLKWPPR